MRFAITSPRSLLGRATARDDAMAGVVLGVESVPDGLASGVLAGVNPVAGLYAYLFGMAGATLFTSTALMAVQATGAMSIIVADVELEGRPDPARALFTLSVLTGAVMIVAGLLRFGVLLRFVSNSVITGFITAVGVNIVLGQLGDLTGYAADGANRITRTFDLLVHPGRIDGPTTVVGVGTIVLIVVLERTRLGAFGMVVAIVAGSIVAAVFDALGYDVATVGSVADVPSALPLPRLPDLSEVPFLLVPAVSLAFVGLVQGAGVSAGIPNPDGSPRDASQDFIGQGAGNVAAGLFQGMPVGGSMSASSLVAGAGARSRTALLYAAIVMVIVVVVLGPAVAKVAMPAIAGLLVIVGVRTVKPRKVASIARTGRLPFAVMAVTFVLTLLIPLQYAVLVGVGISVLLFVVRQSTRLVLRRIVLRDDGLAIEVAPPAVLPPGEVVILQPYGAIFFASTAVLHQQLPSLDAASRGSVVILRLRGADEAGVTMIEALTGYAEGLAAVESKLVIVTDNERLIAQLHATRAVNAIGASNLYLGTEVIGETVRRAAAEAADWVADHDGVGAGVNVWVATVLAIVPLGAAAWWVSRRPRRPHQRIIDADRGDWPSDQMAP